MDAKNKPRLYLVNYWGWLELLSVDKTVPEETIIKSYTYPTVGDGEKMDVDILPSFMMAAIVKQYGGLLKRGRYPLYTLPKLATDAAQRIVNIGHFLSPIADLTVNESNNLSNLINDLFATHGGRWDCVIEELCTDESIVTKIVMKYNLRTTEGRKRFITSLEKTGIKKIPPILAKRIIIENISD